MFKTFRTWYTNTEELDSFLNHILAEGYEPVFLREFYKPAGLGYSCELRAEVYVTARQVQKIAS